MAVGIDWFAVIVLLGAYAFAQIRAIPVPVRYGVFALASAFIALYKLRGGAAGANLLFVLIAGGLAVYYGYKALQAARRR